MYLDTDVGEMISDREEDEQLPQVVRIYSYIPNQVVRSREMFPYRSRCKTSPEYSVLRAALVSRDSVHGALNVMPPTHLHGLPPSRQSTAAAAMSTTMLDADQVSSFTSTQSIHCPSCHAT